MNDITPLPWTGQKQSQNIWDVSSGDVVWSQSLHSSEQVVKQMYQVPAQPIVSGAVNHLFSTPFYSMKHLDIHHCVKNYLNDGHHLNFSLAHDPSGDQDLMTFCSLQFWAALISSIFI